MASRDQWGHIHARTLHPLFYDESSIRISPTGAEYLRPIFTNVIGYDDVEQIRDTRLDYGNLFRRYHGVNTDIRKRGEYVDREREASM